MVGPCTSTRNVQHTEIDHPHEILRHSYRVCCLPLVLLHLQTWGKLPSYQYAFCGKTIYNSYSISSYLLRFWIRYWILFLLLRTHFRWFPWRTVPAISDFRRQTLRTRYSAYDRYNRQQAWTLKPLQKPSHLCFKQIDVYLVTPPKVRRLEKQKTPASQYSLSLSLYIYTEAILENTGITRTRKKQHAHHVYSRFI